jgi:hypothetical protein
MLIIFIIPLRRDWEKFLKLDNMKYISFVLLMISSLSFGQLTLGDARTEARKYKLGSYSYHEDFIGHAGYGAPLILTSDGGAAFLGDTGDSTGSYGQMVKLNKAGVEEWKQMIRPQFDEMESQSVAEDKKGNYYLFMLSYDSKRYRGGSERIVFLDKSGKILWDKTIGEYTLTKNPVISYIRTLDDGRIYLRGHVVTDEPAKGKDPEYRFWEGWIDNQGNITRKTGDIINWSDKKWETQFKPDGGK